MDSTAPTPPAIYYRAPLLPEGESAQGGLGTNRDDCNDPDAVLAACWQARRSATRDWGRAIIIALMGIGLLTQGAWNLLHIPSEFIEHSYFVGGLCLFLSFMFLMDCLMRKPRGIEVTGSGISIITDKHETSYQWSEIHKVLAIMASNRQQSSNAKSCRLEPLKGKPFTVASHSYQGEPGKVVELILANCDYIVRNPQGYTLNKN